MPNEKKQNPKWSADEIKLHIKKITELVEKQRGLSKNLNFTGITSSEIEDKFKRINSPFIWFQSWSGSTSPGGTINYNIGIYNPDPVNSVWLFNHVWVGSGNIDPIVGTFLLNVDSRFPRLTQPAFAGLNLAPGATATLSYSLKIPSTVEKTNYLGNSCLMRFNWHDIGTYLDRSVFVFGVV